MSYELHPSERLKAHFREKPWQGADPFEALFLFVGLDANYDPSVEKTLPEIFSYLDDGVAFWRQHGEGVHHPFRLPHYSGSGKRYHDKFAEIGLTSEQGGKGTLQRKQVTSQDHLSLWGVRRGASSATVITHSESRSNSPLFPQGAVSYCRVLGPSFFL